MFSPKSSSKYYYETKAIILTMSSIFEILSGGARLSKKPKNPSSKSAQNLVGVVNVQAITKKAKKTKKIKKRKRRGASGKETSSDDHDSDDDLTEKSALRLSSSTSPLNSPKRSVTPVTFSNGDTSRSSTPPPPRRTSADALQVVRGISALQQKHEQISAFRRRMNISVSRDCQAPDPIATFEEIPITSGNGVEITNHSALKRFKSTILSNLDSDLSKWKNPTPIQMQAIPSLLANRDVIGAAPTGSGKSGGFILPALIIASRIYSDSSPASSSTSISSLSKKEKKNMKKKMKSTNKSAVVVRTLLLAPSRELAAQLHREVLRISHGKAGGFKTMLLEKKNAASLLSGGVGGAQGLDCLVSTPLRLCELLSKEGGEGVLESVRLVVLDEADRLLDGRFDGNSSGNGNNTGSENSAKRQGNDLGKIDSSSGSASTKTFLRQIDSILSACSNPNCIRALFSATITSTVKTLSDSILRDPIEITVGSKASGAGAGVSTDVDQSLLFVGKEEGKLLEIRNLIVGGGLSPPVLIFVQNKERAEALTKELQHDRINVDSIHGGRSQAARESAVNKFRAGETWVLVCTDLVARGLDFKAVNMVINYDFPQSGVDYVHRIGRCGRGGRKGEAVTYFTESDFGALRGVANIMKVSGCENVQDWMLTMKKESREEKRRRETHAPARECIEGDGGEAARKKKKKRQMIEQSKRKNKNE